MTDARRSRREFLGAAATGIAYFILATASLLWTRGGEGIATMWPAGGLALAILASVDRRSLPSHAVALALGSMAANLACGTPISAACIYTAANLVETLVAVLLLSRCPFGSPSFVDVRQVACFCAIATIAAFASAVVASASLAWSDWGFSLSWFATDLLGIVLAAPLAFLSLRHAGRGDAASPGPVVRPATLAIAMAFVALASLATFMQSSLPLLFLPLAALLGATHAAGPLGAAAGTLVIALIGSAAITFGHGPTALIHGAPAMQAFFLQFYLVVLLGCALPMAALQATRDLLVADLTERNRLLFMAERVAKVGHWHLDLGSGKITWSEEVFRIHGFQGTQGPSLEDAISAYHEDDREDLAATLREAIRTGAAFGHRARIVRPDGSERHVDVLGEVASVGGTARSVFGVVQDVTQQVEVERHLEAARQDALAAASRATALAETDALTGLANRRKVLDAISAAVDKARGSDVPVSVAIFDVDHFKRVNDMHGHPVGDAVLRRVAGSATRAVRASDLVGRIGGEEFAVLLSGADHLAAMEVAERLRACVETDGTGGPGDPKVTTSIGVATLVGNEDVAALMLRADAALYQAKADGRNASRLAA